MFARYLPALALLGAALPARAEAIDPSFLEGKWTIENKAGEKVGESVIVSEAPGAVLFEMRATGGKKARPLWFINDEAGGGWAQLFVGVTGKVRSFNPQSEQSQWPIVIGNDVVLKDGSPVRFRLTMDKASDDQSTRLLEMSRDEGKNWSTVFDYVYKRAE